MMPEDGKYYRTRNGLRAGPMEPNTKNPTYPWRGLIEGGETITLWTNAGSYNASGSVHAHDLISIETLGCDKPMDRMTLDDYRRGIAKVYGNYRLY